MTRRLSRPAAVGAWVTGGVAVHALLPLAVGSRLGRVRFARHGAWRTLGGICLCAGTTGLVWSLAQHLESAPAEGYEIGTLTPGYLLRRGPYQFSRNPMYVSELAIWSGWTLLFADRLLAIVSALLGVMLDRAARIEEAALAERFGDKWREYAATTPRWVGLAPFRRGCSG
jgi:protein-S-isoprenylcysteine O-methyltransferase Ste14